MVRVKGVVDKPVAPKTTRSYVRPCGLNTIVNACGVRPAKLQSWCFGYGTTSTDWSQLTELERSFKLQARIT
jgi:hypothetical protein